MMMTTMMMTMMRMMVLNRTARSVRCRSQRGQPSACSLQQHQKTDGVCVCDEHECDCACVCERTYANLRTYFGALFAALSCSVTVVAVDAFDDNRRRGADSTAPSSSSDSVLSDADDEDFFFFLFDFSSAIHAQPHVRAYAHHEQHTRIIVRAWCGRRECIVLPFSSSSL